MRHTITTIAGILLFISNTYGQYQLGLRLETSSGVNSLAINPTGNLNNPNKWDVNLLGGGIFMQNNYAFIEETNFMDFMWRVQSAKFVKAEDAESDLPYNNFIVDFYDDADNRFVNSMTYVAGPSFALRLGKNHSIGAFYNMRSIIGGTDLPNELSYYKFKSKSIIEQLAIPQLELSILNWSEIGVNYAMKIPTDRGSFNFGVNLKYLLGHQGGYARSNEPYLYGNLPGTNISINLPDGNVGFAGDLDKSKLLEVNGKGVGADIGFSYILQDHEEGYKLKIGASLIDLGYLKFENNAQKYQLNIDTIVTIDLEPYKQYNYPADLDKAIAAFSHELLQTGVTTSELKSLGMSLPAAFSLQADYGVTEKIYINALLIQRLPNSGNAPPRANILAITPRWQTRWFSASAPISIYDWKKPRIGLATRVNWLIIGADDFAAAFVKRKFTGADFYMAIRITPFKKLD